MLVRFLLFSLVVAAFAWLAQAIVRRTRHLEARQIEAGLLIRDAVRRAKESHEY